MKIFDHIIREIKEYVEKKKNFSPHKTGTAQKTIQWPKSAKGEIVLMPDLAIELGHPDDASVSFLNWTHDDALIHDGQITIVGPDINETNKNKLPFGKVVLLNVSGFDEKNAFDRNRALFLAKFDVSLKGFMIKSASQYMAEWCRISKEAVQHNFSLELLGNALINEYKKFDYVQSVELVFITSSNDDVNELFHMGNRTVRIISAMSKMMNEMSYDCTECEYQDVCNDADELKELRRSLVNK
ncbi:MAG: CO dehydrogenase/acetyl-CoA synthase subunit beta-like protein [Candidatus Magnetoglobus multicellularis str. Araruama]|uniref:CO-methylating acetyl-CoA synthase n=1 Tax=Candidatus Magnetoglobus multicellularis str. Araruama TaxID=890399 RepID=A0A1V1PEF5_9BACT|nr:MAG: CO dehydrogenase/acetyl-CoA synthase subunit beta-like protein [Candidatus Magnetoglobus multicellularis str. Araruama]